MLLTQWGPYALVFLIAGSGIAMSVLAGLPGIVFDGVGSLPANFDALPPHFVHGIVAKLLMLAIGLRIAAVVYHQFVRRDGLLSRMGFGKAVRWRRPSGFTPAHTGAGRSVVDEASLEKTPRVAVVQVEAAVGAEVLARKELAVGARHQPLKLFVAQLVELFGRDRLADAQSAGLIHGVSARHQRQLVARTIRGQGHEFTRAIWLRCRGPEKHRRRTARHTRRDHDAAYT